MTIKAPRQNMRCASKCLFANSLLSQRTLTVRRKQLVQSLADLSRTAPSLATAVPMELIQYVQSARNPDIYTRQFVELVMELNQKLKGKTEAFGAFQTILAKELIRGIDGIETDVRNAVEITGGKID